MSMMYTQLTWKEKNERIINVTLTWHFPKDCPFHELQRTASTRAKRSIPTECTYF